MKQKTTLTLLLLIFTIHYSQGQRASNMKDFVPQGWKIIAEVYGDLNKDDVPDGVLVIQKTSKENIILNDISFGSDTLDINPRKIIIAFKQGADYVMVLDNETFIPPQDNEDNSCQDDPFQDLNIGKGVLNVQLHYWYSCGSWFVESDNYTFCYQNNAFELIEFNITSFHRASGESHEVKIDYLTKYKRTLAYNMFDEEVEEAEKTEAISIDSLLKLENMTFETEIPCLGTP